MSKKFFFFSVLLAVGLTGCFYDNQDDLLAEMNGGTPKPFDCDTANVTYSGFIQPLLNANCRSCHRQGSANAGVRLDGYAFVQAVARTGQLVGVLNKDGFSLMPPSGALDSCTIEQVTAWVDAGFQEN